MLGPLLDQQYRLRAAPYNECRGAPDGRADAPRPRAQVVAFVKGTRTAPQCGFSHRVMSLLTEAGAPFDVVNVLDEVYNPGLREALKAYSQWPTIPQVYVGGEFVGGADILEELHQKGELQQLVRP